MNVKGPIFSSDRGEKDVGVDCDEVDADEDGEGGGGGGGALDGPQIESAIGDDVEVACGSGHIFPLESSTRCNSDLL